ncbi:hypothetical protein ACIQU6_41715 [Streptomyces sp. NPDC090442]|uniref:hypothetical protein n=1 Tax=Streptomyces sp. NPDC090442 TaxID=3365962 RepID=UPI0037F8A26A
MSSTVRRRPLGPGPQSHAAAAAAPAVREPRIQAAAADLPDTPLRLSALSVVEELRARGVIGPQAAPENSAAARPYSDGAGRRGLQQSE